MSRAERYSCSFDRDRDGTVTAIELTAVDPEGTERRVRINGARCAHVAAPLREILVRTGVTGRQWSSASVLELNGRAGAHAELLLRAVKPLKRVDRVTEVTEGIATMGTEEASYWHAKSAVPGGLAALRVLLTHGGR